MHDPADDRSAMARAMGWSAQITTISFEMVLPGLGGFWLDQKLGTKPLFLILGVVFGFTLGLWHLLKLAQFATLVMNNDQTKNNSRKKHEGGESTDDQSEVDSD